MIKLNILIVEDDPGIIKQWEEKIEFNNIEEGRCFDISPVYSQSLLEAKDKLDGFDFDAVAIDIRLKGDEASPNKDGNRVFEIVNKKTLSVVAICTGEPGLVDISDDKGKAVKKFTKGGHVNIVDDVIEWLNGKQKMIASIKRMRESIREEMANVFYKSVWPRWEQWIEGGESDDIHTVDALKRHMATHLHATFLISGQQGVHPEEYFFIPPLHETLNTGDIIQHEGQLEIIVTPRCDMIRKKGSFSTYQLVALNDKCVEWADLERKFKEHKDSGNDAKKEKIKKEMGRFTNHNNESASHFIQRFRFNIGTELTTLGPFYAQFSMIRTLERNEKNEALLLSKRIASLSNEFIPSLVERLGTYFSRIGTPDYSHPE